MNGKSKISYCMLFSGIFLFVVGNKQSIVNTAPILPYLVDIPAALLAGNFFLSNIVKEYRKYHRFTWKESTNIRKNSLRFLGILLILWAGTFWVNDNSSLPEPSKTVVIQPTENTIISSSTLLSSSDSNSEDSYAFSEEEIQSAKSVAQAYYNKTVLKPKSFQYDTTNQIYKEFYKQYSSEYKSDELIIFTVTIENSENPPRGIILARENKDSGWKVLNEGY